MTTKTNNLHLFKLDSEQSYIDMWHELDEDFAPSNYIKNTTTLNGYSYNSKAEELIKDAFNEFWSCSESRVDFIMNLIKQGHKSYSSQFLYKLNKIGDNTFIVAVSYLS